jgi:hypothetical protein
VIVTVGATRFWDRCFRQKTNSPRRIAKNTIGTVTPIAIFAPVDRSGVDKVVIRPVLDFVGGLLEEDAGANVLVNVAGKDRVGVKIFKMAVSVLCQRTWTLYALTPPPGDMEIVDKVVLSPAATMQLKVPGEENMVVHDSVYCHANVDVERHAKLLNSSVLAVSLEEDVILACQFGLTWDNKLQSSQLPFRCY